MTALPPSELLAMRARAHEARNIFNEPMVKFPDSPEAKIVRLIDEIEAQRKRIEAMEKAADDIERTRQYGKPTEPQLDALRAARTPPSLAGRGEVA